MEKSVLITLIIIMGALVGLLLIGGFYLTVNPSSARTISVTGQSSIDVVPDLTKVYISVQKKAATSQEAKDMVFEVSDKVTTALIAEGFSREDIQTQGFNVYPEYSYTGTTSRITGYIASQNLVIEFSAQETEKISKVIDASIDNGANIASINFELSPEKTNEVKAQAIGLAAQDAKMQAEALAAGLGKSLGRLVSVSDESFGYYPYVAYASRGEPGIAEDASVVKAETSSISPSEQTISSSVRAVYRI